MKIQERDKANRMPEHLCNMVLILLGMILITGMMCQTGARNVEETCALTEGWYILEGQQRREVSLPTTLQGEQELIFYNDDLDAGYAGQMLTMKGALYEPQILLGDQVLYQYSDDLFPANAPMKAKMNCDAAIPETYKGGETLVIRFRSEDGRYDLPCIYVGTDAAVMRGHLSEIAVMLLIALVMVVLSSVAIGVSLYLYRIHLRDPRFLDAASFLLICAVWCVTDSAVVQQYSGYTSLVRLISFYAFMLMAIPMIHFVRNSADMKKYRILDACIAAFYMNAILQGLLYYFGIFHFIDMLFVTHLLLGAGVSVIAALLVREYRKNRGAELKIIWYAFVMLAGSGVLAMLLYWMFDIPYYELLFECGILIFVTTLLCGLVITMTEHIRYKTEMLVYQRLAKEDSLTGIGNRLAFEEKIAEIQNLADTYENVALIFLDVNGLKDINDRYGHNAGDELIVAAARCINKAFSPWGSCYRIGGDEFCAILLEPDTLPQVWFEALDREIVNYNNSGKRKLSIARGMSYLRDETGCLKRFSDWKYEADQNMYLDKGMRKR
ncbi:MAG: GGDEF domain-containing protein [Lachnospiraceae bacterium]|nr:GGDEF domain-containing protein [Lachnospiraceae bacterium]